MTVKERLHQLVDQLSEHEADDALRYVASKRAGRSVDDWGDLDSHTQAAMRESLRALDDEERETGLPPWRP